MPPPRWSAPALFVLLLLLTAGCRRPAPGTASGGVPPPPTPRPSPSLLPLELEPSDDRLAELIVQSFEKSVAGRLESYQKIERTVREVAPLVARAAEQSEARELFRAMVREGEAAGEEEARRRWVALQEADLLLESGADPDALSRAGAAGVAQWMPATGRANGLSVDEAASRALTAKIDARGREIAWREYLASPGADPSLPGAPAALSPAQAAAELPALHAERETLRAERRRVDARYDPERAVFAQTRYLARLYRRFPGVDWLFQAYHGGEAGAQRTLRRYVGEARWSGSAAAAIRSGGPGGGRLSFERLYLTTDPRTRPAAFAYLYGRADDHRYYWWKLRAAERAITAYRRDPAALRRRWEGMLPGRSVEAWWYPDAAGAHWSLASGRLVPVSGTRGVQVVSPAPRAAAPPSLRPESAGLLALIADTYRKAGGTGDITVGDLAATPEYLARRRALREPSLPPGLGATPRPPHPLLAALPPAGPPPDFDFHQTGLAFDVLRPASAGRRKTLEYALGSLRDRHLLWWTEGERRGEAAYHVVPEPRHAAALAGYATAHRRGL